MRDQSKTKEELIKELGLMRQEIVDLEESRNEGQLRADAEHYRELYENAPIAYYSIRADGLIHSCNRRSLEVLGYPPGDLLGKPVFDLYADTPQGKEKAQELFQKFLLGEPIQGEELQLQRKDGTLIWGSLTVDPVHDDDGTVKESRSMLVDITQRKEMEAALSASQARFQSLYSNTPVMMHSIDRHGRLVSVSNCWLETLGYQLQDVIGRKSTEFLTQESQRYAFETALPKLFEAGYTSDVEFQMVKKNGEVIDVLLSAVSERDALGESRHSFAFMIDVTERKRAEQALRQSEENFRRLVENAWDAFFLHDDQGKFVDVNQMACESLGYTRAELLSLHVWDVEQQASEDDLEPMWRGIEMDTPITTEGVHRRKDGTTFPVEVRLGKFESHDRPLFLALARDITQRNELESQLLQSQKMEAIGRLAGGVAHDFNNILTAITGFSELALRIVPTGSTLSNYIQQILNSADRAAGLTDHLLSFSRRKVIEPRVLNLNEVILDIATMIRPLIGEDVEVVIKTAPDLALVKVDLSQFEQVLMNLVVNARDAMPNGGYLTIKTANVTLNEDYARLHSQASPGEYVMLAVGDSGIGMTEETKAHIFEPFFTTKEEGKGTGLGLATCYGIVKQNGGNIEVYSELNLGTSFKIYLPRVDDGLASPLPKRTKSDALPRGSETVLVVEDDPLVRELITEWLSGLGYQVLGAGDGVEALELFQKQPDTVIQALVTDYVMPRMGGKALANQLKAMYPQLKVIFSSGYTNDTLAHQGVLMPGAYFIQKPFDREALSHSVRAALDAGDV